MEDPSIYEKLFQPFMGHLSQCVGKKTVFFAVQSNSAEIEAMRSGRLHIAAFSTGPTNFAVNIAGSFLIGLFYALSARFNLSTEIRMLLTTGLCGGFTTFSAFSLETLALLERGKYATGALYACGSVLACLAGVVIGRLAVRGVRAALTGSAAA